MLRVELLDGRVREIRVQTDDPGILRTAANLLRLYTQLEEVGASNFLGESFKIETDINQLVDASALRKTAEVVRAVLAGTSGFDVEIIPNAELDLLVWQAQNYSPKGDTATGDYDVTTTRKNLETLNIRRSDGSFDYEVLKNEAAFIRAVRNWIAGIRAP